MLKIGADNEVHFKRRAAAAHEEEEVARKKRQRPKIVNYGDRMRHLHCKAYEAG